MARKWLVLLTILSVLIFVVAGCAPKPAPPVEKPPVEKVVWKIAYHSAPSTFNIKATKWFLDEVEKRSGGRIEFEHFFSQALCPAQEMPDGLKSGLLQGGDFVIAYSRSKFPLANLGYLPCVFPFTDNIKAEYFSLPTITSEWYETPLLKEEFANWGGMPIYESAPGFYIIMGKVRITNLEDLKGKKIRAIGGTADLLKKAGAVIVSTTMPEMYDALSKGVIEAAANSMWGLHTSRVFEVSKYRTSGINLGQMPSPILVSKKDYEALPEDIKKIFQEVKKEFPSLIADIHDAARREAVEAFEKAGIETVEFSAADNAKLRTMSREIWKEHVDKLEKEGIPGREAFNSLQDIIKKHVSGYEPYYLK